MATVPAKIQERIAKGLTRFRTILKAAKENNTNESNTVDIVARMLEEIFGYDRFMDVTKEYADKKTFCDLAIVKAKKPIIMIEGKKIGLTLNEYHTQQALTYAIKTGVNWAVLTNGQMWKVYEVNQDASGALVYEMDMLAVNAKKQDDLDKIYHLCKEAFYKTEGKNLEKYCDELDIVNKYTIAQILISDTVLEYVKRSIRKLSPDTRLCNEQIKERIIKEVINPNAIDCDNEKVKDAIKRVRRALKPATAPAKKATPAGKEKPAEDKGECGCEAEETNEIS